MISFSDYYPFGSIMPMRSSSLDKYRYGFNGQEKENNVNGSYSTTSAEYWMYDGRLGRRWEVDPLTAHYPRQSPYAAFNCNPILFSDPKGLEGENQSKGLAGGKQPRGKIRRAERYAERVGGKVDVWQDSKGKTHVGVQYGTGKDEDAGVTYKEFGLINKIRGAFRRMGNGIVKGLQGVDRFLDKFKGKPNDDAWGGFSLQGDNPYGTKDNDKVKPENWHRVVDVDYSLIEILDALLTARELKDAYDDYKEKLKSADFGKMSNKDLLKWKNDNFFKPALKIIKDEMLEKEVENSIKEARHKNKTRRTVIGEPNERRYYLEGDDTLFYSDKEPLFEGASEYPYTLRYNSQSK